MGTFLIPFNIILKYPSFSEFTTACDVLHYHLLLAFWIVCSGILDFISHPPRYCTRYSRLLDLPKMTNFVECSYVVFSTQAQKIYNFIFRSYGIVDYTISCPNKYLQQYYDKLPKSRRINCDRNLDVGLHFIRVR